MSNYLPVLLVSLSTNAVPDDSSLATVPQGQVDYLSHEWAEEDVWRSWRNMTRQKNDITNGERLENASWRTWWKQRNKLKTISPETLNWLKDSDVTWLYGPLHTAVDWTPPPKPKPQPTEVGKVSSTEDRLDLAKHKSILKHRTITELLQSELPDSPLFHVDHDDDLQALQDDHMLEPPQRPPLLQTKSVPHLSTLPHLRKSSPPRIAPPVAAPPPAREVTTPPPSKQRHITFNTFVEQCIAVDSPRRSPASISPPPAAPEGNGVNAATWDGRTRGLRWAGDDEDSDEEDEMVEMNGWIGGESALSSDSDDDMLEVCLPRSRSGSRSSSQASSSKSMLGLSAASKTIAPIAPARLKTTGVGNSWAGDEWIGTRDDGFVVEEPTRPSASTNVVSAFDADSFDEDDDLADHVYTHESAYFSADGAYDYFAGPDLGVGFESPVREQRGRRGSSGAEIMEIEGARSRSKSRSKSRSRSRTPSPAVLGSQLASSPQPASPPNAATMRASGLLSPPHRGRDSSVSSSSSQQSRGRSAARTSSSSLSDRERSRSSHTSPLGSLSPEYSGVRVSADPKAIRGAVTAGSPDSRVSRGPPSTESSNSGSSSVTATRPEEPAPNLDPQTPMNSPVVSRLHGAQNGRMPVPVRPAVTEIFEDDGEIRHTNPTPANSPVVSTRPAPRIPSGGVAVNGRKPSPAWKVPTSPTHLSFQTASSAATAERSAPPSSPTSSSADALQRSLAPGQQVNGDGNIVGKAVGMVSSAGAYFGLWGGSP